MSVDEALAFSNGTDTSADAADWQIVSGRASLDEARVFAFIQARGLEGATDDEIEVALGLLHQTASARRRGLVLKGRIMDSTHRRSTRMLRAAVVWVIRQEGEDMGKKENELSTNDAVCTPPSIFEPIIAALGPIGFDPCSHPASNVPAATQVLLPIYWTDPNGPPPAEEQNGETLILWGSGLDFHWGGMGLVFINPPYSKLTKEPWIQKARDEADEAVLFLPVRTAGAWWQDEVTGCQAITFLRGRVTHDGETVGAPFHQCLVYCGPNVEHWVRVISRLGWTVITGAKHHLGLLEGWGPA